MIQTIGCAGVLPHRRNSLFASVFFLLSAVYPCPHGAVPSGIDCDRWVDSMIVAGKRSLLHNELDSAKLYFSAAYECGMSKDSMYYFVAEIYLRKGIVDTAMVFNWALEKNGSFDRTECLRQRARIFRVAGWQKKADSLSVYTRKKTQQSVSLRLSGGRDIVVLAPISFVPYELTITPDPDIDDEGRNSGSYLFSYTTGNFIQRFFLRCFMDGDVPLPSRHSFRDRNDTLTGLLGISGGIGKAPVTPELQIGYQVRKHYTLKTDHYYRAGCTYAPSKTILLTAGSEIKQIWREGVDECRTNLTVMKIMPRFRFCRSISAAFKHYFSRTDVYQEEAGVTGTIYPFLPIGFVDSLVQGERFNYYRDAARTIPYDSVFLDEYWNGQPRMKLLRPLPEHNFNLSFKHVWRFRFPGSVQCNIINSVAGVLYPKPVEWFVPEEPLRGDVGYILRNMYLKYAIIRNGADGGYYLNEERSDLYANSVMKLTHHKKQRIDCYITLSFLFERNIGRLGTMYFSTSYLKGYSTVRPGDPVATFDYGVSLRAGWRRQFSLGKK